MTVCKMCYGGSMALSAWLIATCVLPLGAQSGVASDSAQLATITTDTGAFAPGHRDFSRYDTPGLCRAAARWTYTVARLSNEAQLRRDTLLRNDTTGAGVTAAVARACGARFTLANTTSQQRMDLFDLALYEQNDALSLATLTTLVANAKTVEQRDVYWTDATRTYLQFGQVAAAETVAARVGAQGPAARMAQLAAHDQLRDFYDERGDTVRVHQEAEQGIAQGRKRVAHEPSYSYVLEGYRDLMRLAVEARSDSLAAIAGRAQHDLSAFLAADQQGLLPRDRGDWGRFSLDTVISRLAPVWYTYVRYGGGKPAPLLQTVYLFPPPGSGSRDTVRPVPGKVNLICLGGIPTTFGQMVHGWGQRSGYTLAAHLRRWLGMYGAAGLEVTIVRAAQGYDLWDEEDGPIGPRTRVFATPTEEAQYWRWYDQVYQQVPATVAVQIKHSTWLPAPDGRRLTESDLQLDQYLLNKNDDLHVDAGTCAIIARNGTILYAGHGEGYSYTGSPYLGAQVGEHNMFDVVLRWLFTAPGASSPPMAAPAIGPIHVAPSALHMTAPSVSPPGGNTQ